MIEVVQEKSENVEDVAENTIYLEIKECALSVKPLKIEKNVKGIPEFSVRFKNSKVNRFYQIFGIKKRGRKGWAFALFGSKRIVIKNSKGRISKRSI